MTAKTDRVTEAIQAEGNIDPKIFKILVKDSVDVRFKEAAVERQQNANPKKRQSKRNKSQHSGSKNLARDPIIRGCLRQNRSHLA